MRANDVRELQTRLKDLGYHTGAIDGLWGPKTRVALAEALSATPTNGKTSASSRAALLTATDALRVFGDPKLEASMMLWIVPPHLKVGAVPPRIYCNKLMPAHLSEAFKKLEARELSSELVTWNGCFNIRSTKGGTSHSLHSWGLAIDVNAATNAFRATPTLSKGFVECFESSGFDWGGYWRTPDGMHFQLKREIACS
jgi:hypothetical protein